MFINLNCNHNSDCPLFVDSQQEQAVQMEHSYSRDWRPTDGTKSLTTRTVMIHKAPQCPSCNLNNNDEGIDLDEPYNPPIPSYNQEHARESMEAISGVVKKVRNHNSEDDDWEMGIDKTGWSVSQQKLFSKFSKILSLDRLARMAQEGQQHEPILRRSQIDKAVQRIRQALAVYGWETKLSQWIHGLMMDHLPQSYLSAYLDILQTLRAKLPSLVEKMLLGRNYGPTNDLIAPVMKDPWEPIVNNDIKKLPNQPLIVIVPSSPNQTSPTSRQQKWISLFAIMGTVIPIQVPENMISETLTIDSAMEHLVFVTRARLGEIKKESNNRPIVLVGFNAGASLAIQIGLLEPVKAVVCMGFSFHTNNGTRGHLDDQILDLQTPVLFVIGQNAARANQEEIESLREQMTAPSSLVVVGSADDVLRISKGKRKIENVTQTMVDNMVTDEVSEFISNCILNPPPVKQKTNESSMLISNGVTKKRRILDPSELIIKNRRTLTKKAINAMEGQVFNEVTIIEDDNEINSIMSKLSPPKKEYRETISPAANNPITTSYEIVPGKITQKFNPRSEGSTSQIIRKAGGSSMMLPVIQKQKISMIPTNQFVPLKPMTESGPQIISVKPGKLNNTLYLSSTGLQKPVQFNENLYTVTTTPQGNKIYSIRNNLEAETVEYETEEYVQLDESGEILEETIETPDLTNTSIMDLPIVFAEESGMELVQETIEEEVVSQPMQISSSKPIILSNTPVMLTSSGTILPKTNKVIYLKSMKPQPNILSKAPVKYSVVMPQSQAQSSNRPIYINLDSSGSKTVQRIGPDKPNILKPVQRGKPINSSAGILNRNLTVKNLVHIVQQQNNKKE